MCSGGVQSSGAVSKSRWPSWAPVPNKPTVSVDVKQHSTKSGGGGGGGGSECTFRAER